MYLLEVISHFKLVFVIGHVRLDFRVCVIDDGQKHVDQHEEHEEHKEHEEDWSKDAVGLLQLMEIKVSQNDSEQSEAVYGKETM